MRQGIRNFKQLEKHPGATDVALLLEKSERERDAHYAQEQQSRTSSIAQEQTNSMPFQTGNAGLRCAQDSGATTSGWPFCFKWHVIGCST
jgi:hypothetical protein